MDQDTLDMDDDTMRAAASAAGLSMSAWLAQRDQTRTEWPQEVVALAGAWRDLPSAEELREGQPADVARAAL